MVLARLYGLQAFTKLFQLKERNRLSLFRSFLHQPVSPRFHAFIVEHSSIKQEHKFIDITDLIDVFSKLTYNRIIHRYMK
jgi:hypothetical protein